MEYVSKEAVLAALDEWAVNSEAPGTNYKKHLVEAIKYQISELLPPAIDTDADIAEIIFREPKEPIRVHAKLTFCPSCKKQVKDGHSYCKKCGQAILRKDDAYKCRLNPKS